jgi:DNA-binding response OmpR family regulator
VTRRVLIIEDETTLAGLWAELIAGAGFQVGLAQDARAARTHLERETPDLIVLDTGLSDATGHAVCQEIRARPQTRTTPLIMTSDCGRDIDAEKGLALGADLYLGKPFCFGDLLEAIERLLASPVTGGACTHG